MSPSRTFILRPVATSLLMVAILLSGFVAYRVLPVSALPQVDYPTIQILTFYPGASPDVIASSVTAPLERQFGQMPGLNQMTSSSSFGSSLVTLQFTLDLSLDVAEQEVQAAINAAGTFLPRDLPNPPIYSKTNPADAPILTLGLTSDTLPLSKVQDLADTRLAQKIAQLPGVGLVTISGGQKPAVRIQANPTALASEGISLEDIRTAIAAANVNQAKGNFDGPRQAYTIGANDQLLNSDQYRSLIVAYRNGRPVRLSDVSNVIDDVENAKQSAWINDRPAIVMNIQRQPGANIISVVDRITALLPQLKSTLPPAVDVSVLTDRTTTIRASVDDVQFELILTIALVVMVIFLFLRTLAGTVIPSIAVPLSLVGTFGVMYLLGYSLNNLTLMALTISTGFVVDDAIVMIENITRYIEQGDSPLKAALKGSEQIGFTIISLTVSLIAVLIPLLFMGDVVGRLFREFAVTLSVTILVSAVVSLTLTPMMCAKLLKHTPEAKQGRFYRWSEGVFNRVIDRYGYTLRWVLGHQRETLIIAGATLIATVLLYLVVPKGFFPVQDTGVIVGISEAPQTISFEGLGQKQQELADVILEDPAVESLSSFIGVDGTNTTVNSGRIQINLKPLSERKISASDIIRRLQPNLEKIEGITLFMQPVQDLSVEDRVSRTQYQYSLEDANAGELNNWAPVLVQKLQSLPELRDVASDQQNSGLRASLVIDRSTAARLGVSTQAIDDTLYDAFGQRQVSTIFTQLNQYHVILEIKPDLQRDPGSLSKIYIGSSNPLAPAPAAVGAAPIPTVANTTSPVTTAPPQAPITPAGAANSTTTTSTSTTTTTSTTPASIATTSISSGTSQSSTQSTGGSGGSSAVSTPAPASTVTTTSPTTTTTVTSTTTTSTTSQTAPAGGGSTFTAAAAVPSAGSTLSLSYRGGGGQVATSTLDPPQIPLSAVTRFQQEPAALSVNHQAQFPVVTLSFNLAPGAALGDAVKAIEKAKEEIGMPTSVQASFQGTAQAFQASLSNEPILILAALITVYIVLGVLYESYIHPVTILSTLPSAGVGAILALLICRIELDVIALIGIILLIGIVKKNGIMMIDFALDAEREGGKKPEEAIYEACLLRFRPIMMTTMAALLAGIPLAFVGGVGAELRRPLGITMIGGLLLSQLLTLYTTPVIYLAFDRVQRRFRGKKNQRIQSTDDGELNTPQQQ